jgi:hypothetical protein
MGSDLPLCDPLWVFYSSGFLSCWLGALFNKACFIKKALVGWLVCLWWLWSSLIGHEAK